MDTQQLIDRLEEHGAEVPVGPPPLGLMRTRARRQRQGRAAVVAAAAAVAVIGVGVAWPGGWGDAGGSGTPVASDAPADPDTPPDGFRYVGVGDVVAAVPAGWGTNSTKCGTPLKDTVVIDPGPTCLMLVPRPADVDSLVVQPAAGDLHPADWTAIEVAGEPALRSPVSRQDGVVSQTVVVPARDVSFLAQSSSADGGAVVGSLLDSLTVLRDHTTVPGFQDLADQQGGQSTALAYVGRLKELGLQADVVTENGQGEPAGTVLKTVPGAGSMVAAGDTIRVFAAR